MCLVTKVVWASAKDGAAVFSVLRVVCVMLSFLILAISIWN